MANKEKKAAEHKSTYSRRTRLLALILSVLVTGGVVTYLITFIMSFFH